MISSFSQVKKVDTITKSNYYKNAINIVFIDNSGTDKIYLSITIGHKIAIKNFIANNYLEILIMKEYWRVNLNYFININY